MTHKQTTPKLIKSEFPHSRAFLAYHGIDVAGLNYVVGHPADGLRGSRGLTDLSEKVIYVADAQEKTGLDLVNTHELVHLSDSTKPILRPFIENGTLPFRVLAYLEGRALLVEKIAAVEKGLKRAYNLNVALAVVVDTLAPAALGATACTYALTKAFSMSSAAFFALGIFFVRYAVGNVFAKLPHLIGSSFMSEVHEQLGQNLEQTLNATEKLIPTFFDLFSPNAYVKKLNEIAEEEI